jgi:hypothetical protein
MNAIDIEKLNQLISRTDISGNDKVKKITDFIDSREFGQQERMYSEEEVLNILVTLFAEAEDAVTYFEQFKKK